MTKTPTLLRITAVNNPAEQLLNNAAEEMDALVNFAHQFLDPEGYGWAVSAEIRDDARRVLGMEPVETVRK